MRRRALTLIETLVVIAIISVLLVVLLAAIQHAREAARRAACAHKLRQIGVALHSYVADNGCFPPDYLPGYPFGGPWDQNVPLLLYLEHNALYNALNLGQFWQDASNTTVGFTSPGSYLCPSDTKPPPGDYGFTNYPACGGSGRCSVGFDVPCPDDEQADGLFNGLTIRPQYCTDGLSHTAAFSEQVHGSDARAAGVALPVPSPGVTYFIDVLLPTQANLMSKCERVGELSPAEILGRLPRGTPWFGGLNLRYTHLFTPGRPSCFGSMGDLISPLTATSRHPHGVQLLLADGHVRFVTQDIDVETWRALGSRNGNEQIEF
jgi:prepilin-type N-terminal cleavage/methylation domain-containing protein/prepilin-type processing-associated H-X9-DG protein